MFDDKAIKEAQQRMETARWNFESQWAEVGGFLYPTHAQFGGQFQMQGSSRSDRTYDEYAQQAFEDGVSVALSYVMPRGQRWQKLTIPDEKIMARVANRQWLEMIEKRLFALRNDPQSGFAHAAAQGFGSLLAYGTQSMWVDIRRDRATGRAIGLSYQSEHIGKVFIETDAEGNPYRIHYKFTLTAEQARLKWGDKLPEKVAKGAVDNPQGTFDFIHAIEPNRRVIDGRIDAAGMAWQSCYFSVTDNARFAEGGYRQLRRIVSRYARADNESYGRGPGMTILPAVRAVQIIMQDRVLAAEMNVKRPLLAQDDELDGAILDLGAFGVTYGGLDEMGRRTIEPLFDGVDATDLKELHAQLYAVIDKAFFRDMLQLRREMKTHITATRIAEEIAEKGVLLEPLSRQEDEWFAPMLACELDLMSDLGMLDDMPREIAEWFAIGGGLDIRYDNQLANMQAAGDAVAYLRTAEQVGLLAQYDPSVVQAFLREFPFAKVLPNLARINGVPALWESSEDEKRAMDEQAQAQAQLQQLLQTAPALAQAGKDVAQGEAALAA